VGLNLRKADHILIIGERDEGADRKHPMRRHTKAERPTVQRCRGLTGSR
jgi:hypothetical protein